MAGVSFQSCVITGHADLNSSCDVPISEGPVNLSWPAIMKQINEDPLTFYQDGGWEFIAGTSDVSVLI
jgi:nucleosome binding factor SPN SPT16 subunit